MSFSSKVLNTMIDNMVQQGAKTLTAKQYSTLKTVDDLYNKGSISIPTVVRAFIKTVGEEYIMCIPDDILAEVEASTEKASNKTKEKEMPVIDTLITNTEDKIEETKMEEQNTSLDESIHHLTMTTMSNMGSPMTFKMKLENDTKEAPTENEVKQEQEAHDMIAAETVMAEPVTEKSKVEVKTEETVKEDKTVNVITEEPKVEAIPMTIHVDETPVENETTAEKIEEAIENATDETSNFLIRGVQEALQELESQKVEEVKATTEERKPVKFSETLDLSEVKVPNIKFETIDPKVGEEYKLVSDKWLRNLAYQTHAIRHMFRQLGKQVGVETDLEDDLTTSNVFGKVSHILNNYDVDMYKDNKLKDQIDKLQNELNINQSTLAKTVEELSQARSLLNSYKSPKPTGKYVVTLWSKNKQYYISSVKDSVMISEQLGKALEFITLESAGNVLEFLIQNGEKLKLTPELMSTISIKQVCLSEV